MYVRVPIDVLLAIRELAADLEEVRKKQDAVWLEVTGLRADLATHVLTEAPVLEAYRVFSARVVEEATASAATATADALTARQVAATERDERVAVEARLSREETERRAERRKAYLRLGGAALLVLSLLAAALAKEIVTAVRERGTTPEIGEQDGP